MPELLKSKPVFSETQCSSRLSAVEDALFVVGGRWTIRVMIGIMSGHTRFNDLQRTLHTISARVLSAELKDLELNGLVERRVLADQKPVVVDYMPTEYSKSLREVIAALADWGNTHKKKIRGK